MEWASFMLKGTALEILTSLSDWIVITVNAAFVGLALPQIWRAQIKQARIYCLSWVRADIIFAAAASLLVNTWLLPMVQWDVQSATERVNLILKISFTTEC